MKSSLKIAITSDPFIPVPPINYGGIERIIHFLVEGLVKRGHEVCLVAHPESKVSSSFIPYPPLENGVKGHIKHILTLNKLKGFQPDIIHSFSRLAYLVPFFRSSTPKLMSYQREPTLSQVQKAVKFSKKGTMAFTGCSKYISDQITPFAPSFPIYNGIDLSIYDFKAEVADDAPLVFLGRIEPIKGTHNAIEIAQKTGRKLIIAGNIPAEYQNYFDSKIKPFLSDRIEYIGLVNDVQKNEILGKAAAFLMPIEWNEPFGIVMAEALACGTPVIGTNRGAVPEVVKNGVNGFFADTVEELVSLTDRVGEIDRAAARKDCEERFSSEKIIDDYLEVYQKLIKKA